MNKNSDRMSAANEALEAHYRARPDSDPDAIFIDLLTSLRHWAHDHEEGFDAALLISEINFQSELDDEATDGE